MKKISAILLALIMMLSMVASAQTVGTASDTTGSITITNASKGETYAVYKLFDATVTGDENGSIAYTGDIPASLSAYFTKDTAGNISSNVAEINDEMAAALKAWAETAEAAASIVSDGSALTFEGLSYGYYVITTTQGDAAISVDSTNPDVTVVDKNSTTMANMTKTVDDDDVFIGQEVTYTITFKTSNYEGQGASAQQITKYTVTDTLPEFLENVTVTGITVDGTAIDTQQFADIDEDPETPDAIELTWAQNGTSLYKNGAVVVITYTATVADVATIGSAGNTNEATVTHDKTTNVLEAEETIYTWSFEVKKTDDNSAVLAGATFQFPFYVQETADTDGAYIYAGTEPGAGLTNTLTTPDTGIIEIKGVNSDSYVITETKAPDGYNKLTDTVTVTVNNGAVSHKMTSATGDATQTSDGVVVIVNRTGSELPSTGGIGTTIFYTVGGLMMAAAIVLLVAKKKVAASK